MRRRGSIASGASRTPATPMRASGSGGVAQGQPLPVLHHETPWRRGGAPVAMALRRRQDAATGQASWPPAFGRTPLPGDAGEDAYLNPELKHST